MTDFGIRPEHSFTSEFEGLKRQAASHFEHVELPSSSPTKQQIHMDNSSQPSPTKALTTEELQKAAGAPGAVGSEPIPAKSLVIKTKKPRPYACPTCTRSFARLEHLKRHERSHTKEKPFQCPVCERSFARRDLLLRHKQKLHASFSPTDEKHQVKETAVGQPQGFMAENPLASPLTNPLNPGQNVQSSGSSSSPGNPQMVNSTMANPAMANSAMGNPAMGNHGMSTSGMGSVGTSMGNNTMSNPMGMANHRSLGPSNAIYATSPHLLPTHTSNSSPSVGLQSQMAQIMQSYEGMDLLTPLRSASPPENHLPGMSSMGMSTQNGFMQPSDTFNKGFSQQIGFPPMNAARTVDHSAFGEWRQLNPLAHELEMLHGVAPSFRAVSNRTSRASSFSAASATTYLREKDLNTFQTSQQFGQEASEVGFATPQAYPVDGEGYDFEPLDLNFVSPAQLSQPPPRKRRVSLSATPAASSYDGGPSSLPMHQPTLPQQGQQNGQGRLESPQPGPAMLALRAQARTQRQLFQNHHFGSGSIDSPASLNSVESGETMGGALTPSPQQSLNNQQMGQQHQQQPQQQPHQQQQAQQQQQRQQSNRQQSLDSLFGSFGDFGSPGMTPGFTPDINGMTPAFTPSMHAPFQSSMSPLPEDSGEIKDFMAQQNEDFVNSLFDAEGKSPKERRKSGFWAEPDVSVNAISAYTNANTNTNTNGNGNGNEASGMQRFVDAYFGGFDTHLSFVHKASQVSQALSEFSSAVGSPAISPPSSSSSIGTNAETSLDAKLALTQALAAVGAQSLGERGEAQAYYWAARDHTNMGSTCLEGLQADILIAVLGLFFDEPSEHAASLDKLSTSIAESEFLVAPLTKSQNYLRYGHGSGPQQQHQALELSDEWPANAERLWDQFVANQSRVRTLHALHAVCCWVRRPSQQLVNVLESCGCAPCDDDLWRAPTSDIWLRVCASKELDAHQVAETGGGPADQFRVVLTKLRNGEIPQEVVSQYTLQSLLLALETSCDPAEYSLQSSRAALRAWETYWARSPDASLDPNPDSGPIMSDCVGIVSLVAFSSLKMRGVLDALWQHDFSKVSLEVSKAVKGQQHSTSTVANYAVDTLVWCEGHVSSHSIFFTTLLAVAECGLVLAEALRHINSKNTPISQTEDQLIQRSRKLVSTVLKVSPSADIEMLPNHVLRAAVCLIKLSDWPLVGALSRMLLGHLSS